jgi:hypothetical protein
LLEAGGVGSVGEVGVGSGDASSEGEHAETSDARRIQAARHIMVNISIGESHASLPPCWRPTGCPVAFIL